MKKVMFVSISLIMLSGCENYKEKYEHVLDENITLENRLHELEANLEEMQSEMDEKTQQIEELESENEDLKNILEEAGIEY